MSKIRTSTRMVFNKTQDLIGVGNGDNLVSQTFLPLKNGDTIETCHYQLGQTYGTHFDYFHDNIIQTKNWNTN